MGSSVHIFSKDYTICIKDKLGSDDACFSTGTGLERTGSLG